MRNSKMMPATSTTNRIAARLILCVKKAVRIMNFSVATSNPRLNQEKNLSKILLSSPGGFNRVAARAGLRVSALMDDIATAIAMVMANCWYKRPVIPPMAATGTNTAISASEVATIGPDTSRMASIVASRAAMPFSIFADTASTTTMASSTTIPIASTSPSSDSVLMVKPSKGKTINAPINETGTVKVGISVERAFCRKMYTTRITRATA